MPGTVLSCRLVRKRLFERSGARPARVGIPIAAVLLLLLLAPLLPADDDHGGKGAGEPVPGPGYAGEPLSPGADGHIFDYSARNVALHSWLTSEDLSGKTQRTNDVWGYVSPSGREYAIVGLVAGTAFVEVTDPSAPEPLAFVSGPPSLWRDMKTHGEFAYIVNETGGGVQIVDLTRIDRGRVRLRGSFEGGGLATAHNISINEESGYAYLSGSNLANGGLVALDLSDPVAPELGPDTWPLAYIHDMQVVTWKKGPYAGREIAFAFAARDGLQILDVTDKANLALISEVRYPGLAYCHSGWLNKKQRFVFVNDELDERDDPSIGTTSTYIVHVRELDRPRFKRRFTNKKPSIDHNSIVDGNFLFLSSYTAGLRVYNAKRPRFLREVGHFDTYPDNDTVGFEGAWGVFAGFPSGVVLISDIQRGLFVLSR